MLSLCFGKVVQDFGHSTFFLSTHVPASNIKRGARGCFCISDSSGAGFCPSTVWFLEFVMFKSQVVIRHRNVCQQEFLIAMSVKNVWVCLTCPSKRMTLYLLKKSCIVRGVFTIYIHSW